MTQHYLSHQDLLNDKTSDMLRFGHPFYMRLPRVVRNYIRKYKLKDF
jgi:hypothetical protein